MLLLFLVVATATRCPLNEDSNDNAQSLPLRIDFAAFPAFPAEVVVAPRKVTPNPLGPPANSDNYASLAIGFRARARAAASAGRDGYRMNDAKSGAAGRRAHGQYNWGALSSKLRF